MVVIHLVLVLSDLPVGTEGREGRLEAVQADQWVDKGGRLCPGSCCIGGIPLMEASLGMEGSMRGGGVEDSVGHREEAVGR